MTILVIKRINYLIFDYIIIIMGIVAIVYISKKIRSVSK